MRTLLFLTLWTSLPFISKSQVAEKRIIATWITTQFDERTNSTTEEVWVFKIGGIGSWERKLRLSDDKVICDLMNPFKWKISPQKKIRITLGKTECNCKASEKRIEDGQAEFVDNLKKYWQGNLFEYKLRFDGNETMYFDTMKLTKK